VLIPLTPGTPRSFLYFSNFPFISLLSPPVTLSYRHSLCHSPSLALGYSAGYSSHPDPPPLHPHPHSHTNSSAFLCPLRVIAAKLQNEKHSKITEWIFRKTQPFYSCE
jgi:hypothetical protein